MTHQKSVSFDEFTRNVIDIACSHAAIHPSELFSSKRKDVVNVRSIISVILRENGSTYQSIADILSVDVRNTHSYVMGHDNRMADKKYSSLFKSVQRSMNDVESISDDIHLSITNLLVRLEKLESRVNHLTHLLTA